MMMNLFKKGRLAEKEVLKYLKRKHEKVVLCVQYDDNGEEKSQIICVNGDTYPCPDIEVYNNEKLDMRVEVKSFSDFVKNESFPILSDVFIISKQQFNDYLELERRDETPIYIVFVIGKAESYKFYWATLESMLTFPKRECFYNWVSGGKKLTYFFRAQDFCNDITLL